MKNLVLPLLFGFAPIFGASASFAQQIPEAERLQTHSDFKAKLLVMEEGTLVEFEKPADEVPHIREVGTAKIGDVIALKLIFTGMDLRANNTAEVVFDIAITQPDGTPYGGGVHENVIALKQEIFERDRVFNSDAVLVIGFEPEDPLGVYDIQMNVRDIVGGHELSLAETITLVE